MPLDKEESRSSLRGIWCIQQRRRMSLSRHVCCAKMPARIRNPKRRNDTAALPLARFRRREASIICCRVTVFNMSCRQQNRRHDVVRRAAQTRVERALARQSRERRHSVPPRARTQCAWHEAAICQGRRFPLIVRFDRQNTIMLSGPRSHASPRRRPPPSTPVNMPEDGESPPAAGAPQYLPLSPARQRAVVRRQKKSTPQARLFAMPRGKKKAAGKQKA